MSATGLNETMATAEWRGDSKGQGRIETASFSQEMSVPAKFGGTGAGTNSEDLLVGAAATCLSITLSLTFTRLKLPFDAVRVRSTGTVQFDRGLRLVGLVHDVDIVVSKSVSLDAAQRDEMLQVATGAEKSCFVSRALSGNAELVVRPRIVME